MAQASADRKRAHAVLNATSKYSNEHAGGRCQPISETLFDIWFAKAIQAQPQVSGAAVQCPDHNTYNAHGVALTMADNEISCKQSS